MENNYDVININVRNDGIFGYLYMPKGNEKYPLVIYSHELANNYEIAIPYAEYLASKGIATYIFDYPGGSNNSKSKGKTTDMTISTEVKDLECVFNEMKDYPGIDDKNIFVIGASQGGTVASMFARKHTKDLKGLILLYPGFNIYDGLHEYYKSLDNVEDIFSFRGWIDLSKKFVEDVWYQDYYNEIGDYKGEVLIIHGNADVLVPIKYSQKAQEVYDHADLIVMDGAKHIFHADNITKACNYIFDFIKKTKQ